MRFIPFDGVIGAAVECVSLASRPDRSSVRGIEAALEEFGILVFPEQVPSLQQQIEFSLAFGVVHRGSRLSQTMEGFPEIFEVGNVGRNPISFAPRTMDGELEWHTDHIQFEIPGKYTLLYAKEVPAEGGDTVFACMYSAYDALDPARKATCRDTTAIHSTRGLRAYLIGQGQAESIKKSSDSEGETRWPLVRAHPLSGRPALYFGSHVTVGLEGWESDAAAGFIRELSRHATQPHFVYRHRWRVGNAVMWDNRRVLHAGTPFDETRYRRYLLRTLVKEDSPVRGAN